MFDSVVTQQLSYRNVDIDIIFDLQENEWRFRFGAPLDYRTAWMPLPNKETDDLEQLACAMIDFELGSEYAA